MVKKKEKLNPEIFKVHAEFCGVLASATRIMIMWLLAEGEKSVSELAAELDLSVPNVSQHLRVMRDRGAVVFRKEGQNVYYRVANENFIKGYMHIRQGIIEQMRKSYEGHSKKR